MGSWVDPNDNDMVEFYEIIRCGCFVLLYGVC